MNRIIEADLLPPPVEETKEKPRILIIDNNRDFTLSAKLGLERTGRYSVWEENEPATAHQTAQRMKKAESPAVPRLARLTRPPIWRGRRLWQNRAVNVSMKKWTVSLKNTSHELV